MRVTFVPGNDRLWAAYYTNQALQRGGGFEGVRWQRGGGLGSLLGGLFRAILPVARSVGKTVGKQALATGAQIAGDVVAGSSIKEAAKSRGKQAANRLLKKAVRATGKKRQKGRGLGVRGKKKLTRSAPTKKGGKKRKKQKDQLGVYFE